VKRVHSELAEVEDLARQVAELQQVPCPWAKGVLLDFEIVGNIAGPTGPGTVVLKHRLGRLPEGWIICRLICPQVLTSVCEVDVDETSLQLYAGRTCRGKVLIF
jgi:hypothetical protein